MAAPASCAHNHNHQVITTTTTIINIIIAFERAQHPPSLPTAIVIAVTHMQCDAAHSVQYSLMVLTNAARAVQYTLMVLTSNSSFPHGSQMSSLSRACARACKHLPA